MPLDGILVHSSASHTATLIISTVQTSPPTKALSASWNLVGPAALLSTTARQVDQALINALNTPAGLVGYTVVVSPSINAISFALSGPMDDEGTVDRACRLIARVLDARATQLFLLPEGEQRSMQRLVNAAPDDYEDPPLPGHVVMEQVAGAGRSEKPLPQRARRARGCHSLTIEGGSHEPPVRGAEEQTARRCV